MREREIPLASLSTKSTNVSILGGSVLIQQLIMIPICLPADWEPLPSSSSLVQFLIFLNLNSTSTSQCPERERERELLILSVEIQTQCVYFRAVIGEVFGHNYRLRSECLQVQPVTGYMFTSSGFALLNWGVLYRFLQNDRYVSCSLEL